MEPILVHKLDDTGREVWSYEGKVLEQTDTAVTLEARFDRDQVEFQGLVLRRGDRFVESFYTNRWYNIFTIYDSHDDHLKGWYCNVSRPAKIERGHVYAEDLALDLIVYPNGRWLVLDEEEYADLTLTPEERRQALQALTELQTAVVRRRGHFKEVRSNTA